MILFMASLGADAQLRASAAKAVGGCTGLFGDTTVANQTEWDGPVHAAWAGDAGVTGQPDRVSILEGVCLDGSRVLDEASFSDDLDGQFAALDLTAERVRVACDPLGMLPLYWARVGEAWLIANRVEILARIIGGALDLDAAAAFAGIGWVGADRTLVDGVRKVPGGARWTLGGQPRVVPLRLAGLRHGPSTAHLAEALVAQLSAVVSHARNVNAPLTAGLDSRLIAALLRAGGCQVRYVTEGNDDNVDVIAARQLAQMLDVPHLVQPVPAGDIADQWPQLTRRLVAQNDGMISLWQAQNVFHDPSGALELTGTGGEIARGFYTRPEDALRRGLVDRFVGRRVSGALLTKEATSTARRQVKQFALEAIADGFSPMDVPDVFYMRERVGRWGAAQTRKALVPVYYPLVARPWFEAAFALSPLRRYGEPLHYRLLRRLAPELFAFPVKNGWRPQHPTVNVALGALRRVRQRPAPVHGAVQPKFAASLVNDVKTRCLDAQSSSLWNVVDRTAFTQATSSQLIMNVATLFEYEAFRLIRADGHP